jgi:hypothetical protein
MDALAKLNGATRALAEARTLAEVSHIRDIAEAARTYARAAKLGLDAQNHATEIKLRAERKAGELLRELDREPGKRTDKPDPKLGSGSAYKQIITENDIPHSTAHRWQEVAKVPEPVFEEYIAEVKESRDELSTAALLRVAKQPHVANNSGDNEWYTPLAYIEAAQRAMGGIDLDPASSLIANATVQANDYFTADDDGLIQDWHGRVWMNPPYAGELIGKFCAKLVVHYRRGDVDQAIVLVNNATETAWFNELIGVATAVVFPRGRVRFLKCDGALGAPLQGQAIIYIGERSDFFIQEFRGFGWVARL